MGKPQEFTTNERPFSFRRGTWNDKKKKQSGVANGLGKKKIDAQRKKMNLGAKPSRETGKEWGELDPAKKTFPWQKTRYETRKK